MAEHAPPPALRHHLAPLASQFHRLSKINKILSKKTSKTAQRRLTNPSFYGTITKIGADGPAVFQTPFDQEAL
jgi:hypothetical protein